MTLNDTFFIYILDDEYAIVHFLKEWLHAEGFLVESSTSVETAVKDILSKTPDLLLVDYHLGGVTALDFLDSLHSHNLHIPCMIVSGATDTLSKHLENKKTTYDILDFLPKNLSLELARDRILYHIRNHFNVNITEKDTSI